MPHIYSKTNNLTIRKHLNELFHSYLFIGSTSNVSEKGIIFK